jgi:hypothetical protein
LPTWCWNLSLAQIIQLEHCNDNKMYNIYTTFKLSHWMEPTSQNMEGRRNRRGVALQYTRKVLPLLYQWVSLGTRSTVWIQALVWWAKVNQHPQWYLHILESPYEIHNFSMASFFSRPLIRCTLSFLCSAFGTLFSHLPAIYHLSKFSFSICYPCLLLKDGL